MVALDAETGTVVWTSPRGKGFSSPAVFNDSVYVGTSSGTVVRLDASDGAMLWETRLLATTGFTGISSSPKVVFEWVFIGTFNESGGPGEVVALWEGNGTVAWRHPTESVHFSSPAYADGTVYIGIMGRYNTTSQISFDPPFGVLALDAATGQERWFFPTRGSVAASPVAFEDTIVASAKDGRVYVLDRASGDLRWERDSGAGVSSPAVFRDRVFVGGGAFGGAGRIVALDALTGSEQWSFAPNGPVQSSVTFAEGRIVFSTNVDRGTVYALSATTGALVWSFEPLPSQYILGSPVVADGVVYAPSDNGHIYALGDAGPETPSNPLGVVEVGGGVALAVGAGLVVWFLVRRGHRDGD
jgi:outer membrane protein assembly factor BamB